MLEQNCISESPAKSISQIEKFILNEKEGLKDERAIQREQVYEKRGHVTGEKQEILNSSNYTSKAPVGQIDTSPLLPRGGKAGDVHLQERIVGEPNSLPTKLKYHESANR